MAEQHKAAPMALEICAMDRAPYRVETGEITLPGEQGEFMVLPGHAPLIATLDMGVMKTKVDGADRLFAINGGIVRVLDNQVLVLTRTAESGDDVDRERAESAKKRAEGRLQGPHEKINVARAEAALRRAMIRLKASGAAGA
ncbi:MAG TPA: ATP synthase F1 subunit epsilon [Candidatus Hydrogenedentes bacterium]|nr:ATP synthase F1 subunit epsilon [Candidatus Hydrogenedentota bacterium]